MEPLCTLLLGIDGETNSAKKSGAVAFSQTIKCFFMLPSLSYFNLIAQEHRLLSPDEQDLRSCLKRRAVSLAIIIQARKKQSAR
jgi:hypothetical protein